MKLLTYFFAAGLIFILTITNSAFSQEPIFNRVSPPEGGSWGLISGISQDPQGYMWITLAGGGLYKYDGYQFRHYLHDSKNLNSLVSNDVECVYADRQGIIWIGTYIGLDRLDPATGVFTHFANKAGDSASLSNTFVTCILEDHEGNFWVGTGGGLNKLDQKTGTFKLYKHDIHDLTSISNDNVRVLYADRQGTIWVGCGEDGRDKPDAGGLNRFDPKTGKFMRYMHNPKDPYSIINNHVRAIFEDRRGVIWIGTEGDGLHTMDRAKGKFERHLYDPLRPEKLSRPPLKKANPALTDHITFITEDTTGAIWIGSFLNGLNRYDPKTKRISRYVSERREGGFTDSMCWWSYKTRDGMIWISSFLEGNLFKVDPYHNNISYNKVGYVTALRQDNSGILWIGVQEGLIRKDPGKSNIQHFFYDSLNPASISEGWVNAIFEDRKGNLWTGASTLNRFDRRTQTFKRYIHDPKDNRTISEGGIGALFEDHLGSLWIGTGSGLDQMDPSSETFSHYSNKLNDSNSLSNDFVTAVAEDKTGNLWIGTWMGGGINRLDSRTGKFRRFLPGTSISGDILQDSKGTIWVGAQDGLYLCKDQRNFSRFIFPGGEIKVITVTSIQVDDQNNLWIATLSGIIKLNSERNAIAIYGGNFGVNAPILNTHASCRGPKGLLFFGDQRGYYSFSPEELNINPNPPQIVLSQFQLQNQELVQDKARPFNSAFKESKGITLNHEQNAFSFDFPAIHYSNPEENKHFYMLENYDKDWRKSGSEHNAYYYNVPPGHYVFRVKAASSDGVWAEKRVVIIISPPWWQTWWAYSLYGLIFIAAIYGIDRFQKARLLNAEKERSRQKELIQAKEIEKAYNELKTTQSQLIQSEKMASLGELTAGIAHEIQNPLNFVNNFSEVNKELLDEMKDEMDKGNLEEVKAIANDVIENEEKINHHGKRADAIVKGMLQHSRTAAGKKNQQILMLWRMNIYGLAYHGLRAKDKSFNATLKTDFDESIGKINIIPQDIGRVILNLSTMHFMQ